MDAVHLSRCTGIISSAVSLLLTLAYLQLLWQTTIANVSILSKSAGRSAPQSGLVPFSANPGAGPKCCHSALVRLQSTLSSDGKLMELPPRALIDTSTVNRTLNLLHLINSSNNTFALVDSLECSKAFPLLLWVMCYLFAVRDSGLFRGPVSLQALAGLSPHHSRVMRAWSINPNTASCHKSGK